MTIIAISAQIFEYFFEKENGTFNDQIFSDRIRVLKNKSCNWY